MIITNLEAVVWRCDIKNMLLIFFRKIHMKIPVPDTVFYRVGDLQHATLMKKAILISLFSSKFGKIFKNNYFTEHHRVTSSTDPHKSSKYS